MYMVLFPILFTFYCITTSYLRISKRFLTQHNSILPPTPPNFLCFSNLQLESKSNFLFEHLNSVRVKDPLRKKEDGNNISTYGPYKFEYNDIHSLLFKPQWRF